MWSTGNKMQVKAHNLILVVKLKMCDPTFLPLRANMDLEACKDKYLSCPLPNLILPANIAQTYFHLKILQFPVFIIADEKARLSSLTST